MYASLIFPHQLFQDSPALDRDATIFLIEEFLFFRQFSFHKQKIAFHRASMKRYSDYLKGEGYRVEYIESTNELSDIRKLIPDLSRKGYTVLTIVDPVDYWLTRRIEKGVDRNQFRINWLDSPMFLNSREDNAGFFRAEKKKFFQTSFYKEQRQRFGILLDNDGNPEGGKWTFDVENRKRYPSKKTPPPIHFPKADGYTDEAKTYVEHHFSVNPGSLGKDPFYPTDHRGAIQWLQQFLTYRFHEFGDYEDAIVSSQIILNHSVLTPMLNSGLLTPKVVLDEVLAFAKDHEVPINSTEGFVRQIIGWREFIRGIYEVKGSKERTTNFWGFERKIPESFYTGNTGILPIDQTIEKVLKTGYCHHIERLMVLGNFMVLCEFDPDEVYQWFMELFIDAYDWVMVPNVYGMSLFADGGIMSTKPYISGSNYLLKMSDYKKGPWTSTWDALFWRFMSVHREFFARNPRLSMLVRNLDKMDEAKLTGMITHAEEYLLSLDQ